MNFWAKLSYFVKNNQNIAKIGIGDISGAGISSLFWFYIASSLGPEKFGELNFFIGIAGLAQMLSLFGTSHVLTVYTSKNFKIQSSLISISLILGTISFIITMFIFEKLDASFLILAFMLPEIANGIILGKKCFSQYSKFFLLQKFLLFSLGISFYYFLGFEFILLAMILSYIPYSKFIFSEFKSSKISLNLIQEKKGFIFNNYIISISTAFNTQLDKLIIAPLLGFSLLGEYALVSQIIAVMAIITSILFKYILPQDSRGENTQKIKKYTIIFSFIVAILGMIILPQAISYIFPKFENVVDGIRLASFLIIPSTIGMLYTSKLLASEKSRYILISNLVSTVIFFAGFLTLGPLYGLLGLITVLITSSTIHTTIIFLASKHIEKTQTKN